MKYIPWVMEKVQITVWCGYVFGKVFLLLIHDAFLFFNTMKPIFSWDSIKRPKSISNVDLD